MNAQIPIPYPYQDTFIHDIRVALRTTNSACAVLPTGGGKTVCFCTITKNASERGKSVWIGVHRQELLDQTCKALKKFGIKFGVIAAGYPETNELVQVFMVQTLHKRLHRLIPWLPDLLIVDECHHAPSTTYADIIKALPPHSKSLGFTATPQRLDGKGLGEHYKVMVKGPSEKWLIDNGYLCPARVFGPLKNIDFSGVRTTAGDYVKSELAAVMEEADIIGDAVEHYKKHANGTSAVAFCPNLKYASHVAELFNAAGVKAAAFHSKLSKEERRSILESFRNDRIKVLCSIDIISEGFDLPKLETCILLRKTKSLALHKQQIGRSIRTAEGKFYAFIFDHVGNCIDQYGNLVHGFPDTEYDWTLEGRAPRKKELDEVETKQCPDCFAFFTGRRCLVCGVEKQGRVFELPKVDTKAELVEIKQPKDKLRFLRKEQYELAINFKDQADLERIADELNVEPKALAKLLVQHTKGFSELKELGKRLGYKRGWLQPIWDNRKGEGAYIQALEKERNEREQGQGCHQITIAEVQARVV